MKIIARTIALTILIEGVTILFRYGFNLESTRDTASTIGRMTFGIRIHHGYIGLLIVIILLRFYKRPNNYIHWMLAIGFALIFSDLIHHFFVLWPIEGDPQFHFIYPD